MKIHIYFLVVIIIAISILGGCSSKEPEAVTPTPTPIPIHIEFKEPKPAEWYLILVNKDNYIPDDYEFELMELSNGKQIDTRIYPDLQNMFDTARSEGVYPTVTSAYRTAEEQKKLYEGKKQAKDWVAAVGTSEHQLGLAVDINSGDSRSTNGDVYKWLSENSYKFGFIYRYQKDKTDITGIMDEPWHYRYVGVDAAAEIYSMGVCLEEYIENINTLP